uniref:Uncharacterized protein n=1 Tax=Setaria viridis TaxID=4556 RepID=A0A4U6T2K4_SETVI|nr:hypothetical protein SEVIR_9G350100v2 [Setaria viridis]
MSPAKNPCGFGTFSDGSAGATDHSAVNGGHVTYYTEQVDQTLSSTPVPSHGANSMAAAEELEDDEVTVLGVWP